MDLERFFVGKRRVSDPQGLDAYLYGRVATMHSREHRNALFSIDIGHIPPSSAPFRLL